MSREWRHACCCEVRGWWWHVRGWYTPYHAARWARDHPYNCCGVNHLMTPYSTLHTPHTYILRVIRYGTRCCCSAVLVVSTTIQQRPPLVYVRTAGARKCATLRLNDVLLYAYHGGGNYIHTAGDVSGGIAPTETQLGATSERTTTLRGAMPTSPRRHRLHKVPERAS